MKSLKAATMLLGALCLGAAARAGEGGAEARRALRVAVVDVNKVYLEYKKSNDRANAIAEKFKPRVEAIKQKDRHIKEETRRLATSGLKPDSVEFLKRKQKLQVLRAELRTEQKKCFMELETEEIAGMLEVWKDLLAAAEEYSKDNGIDLVINQQVRNHAPRTKETFYNQVAARTVLCAAEGLDITDALVKRLNRNYERGLDKPKENPKG